MYTSFIIQHCFVEYSVLFFIFKTEHFDLIFEFSAVCDIKVRAVTKLFCLKKPFLSIFSRLNISNIASAVYANVY